MRFARGRREREGGFTLIEALLTIVVGGIVMGAVYQLLISQSRSYGRQLELTDVHNSLRAAAALLAFEIRQAASGDLYSINQNSIALRSPQASGIVCTEHPTLPRFGLVAVAGEISAAPEDSALVLAVGAPGSGDDVWRVLKVQAVSTGPAMGVSACDWGGGAESDVVLELAAPVAADTAGIAVGAPLIVFRRVEYRVYEENGRWWLGRKVGGAASYEKLTGPLLPEVSGGLVFTYRDAAGDPTADPMQVTAIEFVLRAESARRARSSGTVQFLQDSLALKVALRG